MKHYGLLVKMVFCSTLVLLISLCNNGVWGQVINPADKQNKPQEEAKQETHHSWELPPIVISGEKTRELREEDRVGSYEQPRWTASRRFAETRVYVVPEGQFEFEYWLTPEFARDGSIKIKKQYEVEMGLPHRFQIDLYIVSYQQGSKGAISFDEEKLEIRWALADWGKIFGNPTTYLEWVAINNAPDHIEAKLLFGGEIVPRWHWGLNFVFEHEIAGDQENSDEVTTGISYTALDEKLSLGAEVKLALVDTKADRGNFSKELLIGPSIQYRPEPQMHLDLAMLFGATHDSPKAKPTLVIGWEF